MSTASPAGGPALSWIITGQARLTVRPAPVVLDGQWLLQGLAMLSYQISLPTF